MTHVMIGGSAGSNEALRDVYRLFQPVFSGTVTICQHVAPTLHFDLRASFVNGTDHKVKEAEDKEPFISGYTFLAPGGYHLLVEHDGSFSLNVDEPVCYSRPSIDVLFETAAKAFTSDTVGILLSGLNNDGAKGLHEIKKQGGFTIVQDPKSAQYPDMPEAALRIFKPDLILSPAGIAGFLNEKLQGVAS
jgi:two-component system chemotaxis response regulator CheB